MGKPVPLFFCYQRSCMPFSRAAVTLGPRIRPRLSIQPRVLDALKTPPALVDDLVEHPNTCVHIQHHDREGVE